MISDLLWVYVPCQMDGHGKVGNRLQVCVTITDFHGKSCDRLLVLVSGV